MYLINIDALEKYKYVKIIEKSFFVLVKEEIDMLVK